MLFHIQDSDRPVWVVADSYQQAVDKWQKALYSESPDDYKDSEDVGLPQGIQYVCSDDELIIEDTFFDENI